MFLSFSAFEVKEIKQIKIGNEIAYEIKLLYLGKYLKDIEKNKYIYYIENKLPNSEFKKELSQFGLIQKVKLENITCKNIFDSFDNYKKEINSLNRKEKNVINNQKNRNITKAAVRETIFIDSKEKFEEKKRIYKITEPQIKKEEKSCRILEKLNLNFSEGNNIMKSICWFISYLSWFLLVTIGWVSLKWTKEESNFKSNNGELHRGWFIWTIWDIRAINGIDPLKKEYYPLQMHVSFYYICFILTLIFITVGCIIFFIKSLSKKEEAFFNVMLGNYSKFHFFPLLCASTLFIIGECFDKNSNKENNMKHKYVAGLVFAILGLLSFIFIYIMTDLNVRDWLALLLIKKGTYSCLIILIWYYFCYSIYYVHSPVAQIESDDRNNDWKKGCGLAFSIIFGIGSLTFSFTFKDLFASLMNLLIFIGLTIAYFKLPSELRKRKDFNKNGDGIVDIIMIVLSVILISLLLIKHREECFKS